MHGDRAILHPPQEHQHRHIGKGATLRSFKDVIIRLSVARSPGVKNSAGSLAERYHVGRAALGARRGNLPYPLIAIDLPPGHADGFARTRGRQDRESKRLCGDTVLPLKLCHFAMKSAIAPKSNAAWCLTAALPFLGKMNSRCPFQRAGFSPCRCPKTLAASSIRSVRLRVRDAVSGIFSQIGCSTLRTSSVDISSTGISVRRAACAASVERHCLRCFSFRKPPSMPFDQIR